MRSFAIILLNLDLDNWENHRQGQRAFPRHHIIALSPGKLLKEILIPAIKNLKT